MKWTHTGLMSFGAPSPAGRPRMPHGTRQGTSVSRTISYEAHFSASPSQDAGQRAAVFSRRDTSPSSSLRTKKASLLHCICSLPAHCGTPPGRIAMRAASSKWNPTPAVCRGENTKEGRNEWRYTGVRSSSTCYFCFLSFFTRQHVRSEVARFW